MVITSLILDYLLLNWSNSLAYNFSFTILSDLVMLFFKVGQPSCIFQFLKEYAYGNTAVIYYLNIWFVCRTSLLDRWVEGVRGIVKLISGRYFKHCFNLLNSQRSFHAFYFLSQILKIYIFLINCPFHPSF